MTENGWKIVLSRNVNRINPNRLQLKPLLSTEPDLRIGSLKLKFFLKPSHKMAVFVGHTSLLFFCFKLVTSFCSCWLSCSLRVTWDSMKQPHFFCLFEFNLQSQWVFWRLLSKQKLIKIIRKYHNSTTYYWSAGKITYTISRLVLAMDVIGYEVHSIALIGQIIVRLVSETILKHIKENEHKLSLERPIIELS